MEEWIMVLFQLLAFFTHAQRQQNLKKKKKNRFKFVKLNLSLQARV